MSGHLVDQRARERFRDEWRSNFAVSANAGSGKTTAISERLAAMALSPGGAELLRKTAVVTFTKKAAAQIGQRARQVLLRRVTDGGGRDLEPLDHLERAFFGTIHSFCLKLAQTYGQTLGINLNPTVVAEDDEALWEEFIEQDPMTFTSLPEESVAAFVRHVPLESMFALARDLDVASARRFLARKPGPPAGPSARALGEIRAARSSRANTAAAVQENQRTADAWMRAYERGSGFLPLAKPQGRAAGMDELFEAFFAPLKKWLAEAASVLAAELAGRYRAWRFERGVQTFADQVDAAMLVLRNADTLERIRGEGWRVILDEAQDTDPQQFAVLVEITRPPGAEVGGWPGRGGEGPRPGHFCMVGDGQQAIYGGRADIGNFGRHIAAFTRGDGGELLQFQVTFRAPHAVIDWLNRTLPPAFGAARDHNFGLPPEAGAPAPFLQVPYVLLEAGPGNEPGLIGRLPLEAPVKKPGGVDAWLAEEAGQIATFLVNHGPEAVGAENWGEVCVIAPRNEWLITARKAFERAGLKVALQMRRNRNGDNPAYAWLTGLLAAVCDPDNVFEWVGVLREVFGVSDALIAGELRGGGALDWGDAERHPEPLRNALEILRPFVLKANDEGFPLERFSIELAGACCLEARAWRVDPSGGVAGELERLLAQAAELGLAGGGPRAWLEELLGGIDDGRPAGKPSGDAINLMTSHSAKGLEWPVVLPIGLWRGIGKAPETGLRLVSDSAVGPRVFFDQASIPGETKLARDRERLRELTRLLYVTLTRPRRALVLPWGAGFGGKKRGESFAELWGAPIEDIPEIGALVSSASSPPTKGGKAPGATAARRLEPGVEPQGSPASVLPRRLLPHQLGAHPDMVRGVRHEASLDEPLPGRSGEEAIDYGLWWHESMEFLPWTADAREMDEYRRRRLAVARDAGFAERGEAEWDLLARSAAWTALRSNRWVRMAELGVFARVEDGAWIDGVIDLVLHDRAQNEVWCVDWKTNRRRSGESDLQLLERLQAQYAPQLRAYGTSLAAFFPGSAIGLWVYSTGAGDWTRLPWAGGVGEIGALH